MSDLLFDCILYDFDGTLGDSVSVILDSFRMAYVRELGECKRTDEDFLSFIGLPLQETFKQHPEKIADKLLKAYLEINEAMLKNDEIDLFEGVIDAIKMLNEMGVKQGIVTSKRRDSLMVTLELKNMTDLFDIVVCREDTNEHKPNPEPILYAASVLGVSDISRVMYVGDALPDIKCANNAGAAFTLVSWTRMPLEPLMLENPRYVLNAMSELPCIIKNQQL